MNIQSICLVLVAAIFVGCETTRPGQTGFAPGRGSGFDVVPDDEKAQATFSGGDGSTIKQAVVITEATGVKTGVRAEYGWLHQHYPGYRLRGQGLRHQGGRSYDEMRIVTADGKSRTVFFDITSFFGKY
ncbi:MAG: hypothetical protein H7Y43_04760 [Akkermansiaceae bacterium]|nr:hypothetical protein [Verrucomicrobiales bacterium]